MYLYSFTLGSGYKPSNTISKVPAINKTYNDVLMIYVIGLTLLKVKNYFVVVSYIIPVKMVRFK